MLQSAQHSYQLFPKVHLVLKCNTFNINVSHTINKHAISLHAIDRIFWRICRSKKEQNTASNTGNTYTPNIIAVNNSKHFSIWRQLKSHTGNSSPSYSIIAWNVHLGECDLWSKTSTPRYLFKKKPQGYLRYLPYFLPQKCFVPLWNACYWITWFMSSWNYRIPVLSGSMLVECHSIMTARIYLRLYILMLKCT